jgi:hypothetical protein
MTKEKWLEVAQKEFNVYVKAVANVDLTQPEYWPLYKQALVDYIEGIDQVTEVYNMENKEN